ncbi:MAG: DUF1778 domain-containing protein [Bryobacteraceae bacterium]
MGRSRSDFMLEAACREAEAVLLDRRYFALSADEFKRFKAILDARQNGVSGASRTYVVCAGGRVAGYYTLAVGAVAHGRSAPQYPPEYAGSGACHGPWPSRS